MRIRNILLIGLFSLHCLAGAQNESPSELLEHSPRTLYEDKETSPSIDEDVLFFEQESQRLQLPGRAAKHYDILPPLSIGDSIGLLDKCYELSLQIEANKAKRSDNLPLLKAIINSVLIYVHMIDNKYESLTHYRWVLIGKQRVSSPVDTDSFSIDPPIRHVNAISFNASRNLVHIDKIKITNTANVTSEFIINRLISDQLPGKQVCYLPKRQKIKEIEITYSPRAEKGTNPRVTLYAGIPEFPEFAKRAIYYLLMTKQNIKDDDYGRLAHNIRKAKNSLDRFRLSRDL